VCDIRGRRRDRRHGEEAAGPGGSDGRGRKRSWGDTGEVQEEAQWGRGERWGRGRGGGGVSCGGEAAAVGRQAVTTVAVATFAAAVSWRGGMVTAAEHPLQEGADRHRHWPFQWIAGFH